MFFMFTPTWGNDPSSRAYCSDGWFNHQRVQDDQLQCVPSDTQCDLIYLATTGAPKSDVPKASFIRLHSGLLVGMMAW